MCYTEINVNTFKWILVENRSIDKVSEQYLE